MDVIKRKTRRKVERLSGDRIVEAALACIAAEGLDELSTRAIAKMLNVKAMAIYHYFPSKDALLDAVADRIVRSIELPAPTGDTRADLMNLQRAYVTAASRHPRAIPLLSGRRFNTPGTLPFLDAVFRVLRASGMDPQETAIAFRVQGYFIDGAMMALAATSEADARPDFRLNDPEFLAAWPAVAEVVPYLRSTELNRIFERGMDIILDAVGRKQEPG